MLETAVFLPGSAAQALDRVLGFAVAERPLSTVEADIIGVEQEVLGFVLANCKSTHHTGPDSLRAAAISSVRS